MLDQARNISNCCQRQHSKANRALNVQITSSLRKKAYSKPKLEYNFLRSSRVSSVPMLQENTNIKDKKKNACSRKIGRISHEKPFQTKFFFEVCQCQRNRPEKSGRQKTYKTSLSTKDYLFMVILIALLSASKERRSDMISAVAPPSFYNRISYCN